MEAERTASSAAKIVLIVLGEYALLVLLFFAALRLFAPGIGVIASGAAALFGILSLVNFILARRIARPPSAPREWAAHLSLLRDEFRRLSRYLDEVHDPSRTAIFVLDDRLCVRSVNGAGRALLGARNEGELIGTPLAGHLPGGPLRRREGATPRGGSLEELLAACARNGSATCLRIESAGKAGRTPGPFDLHAYPWKGRSGTPDRLVVRIHAAAPRREEGRAPAKRPLAARPAAPADRPVQEGAPLSDLHRECALIADHVRALLLSIRSVDPASGAGGPAAAERTLLEMQARRVLELVETLEGRLRNGGRGSRPGPESTTGRKHGEI